MELVDCQQWHRTSPIPYLRSNFPMSSGSSRECLNLQLIASIPDIDVSVFILISIPPGLLEELSLILGSNSRSSIHQPVRDQSRQPGWARRVPILDIAVAGVFGGRKPDCWSQLCRESCH